MHPCTGPGEFPQFCLKPPSSSIKIPQDVRQNVKSSYLKVVKSEVIFTSFVCFCALLEFFTRNIDHLWGAWLAGLVKHVTPDLGVVSLKSTLGSEVT